MKKLGEDLKLVVEDKLHSIIDKIKEIKSISNNVDVSANSLIEPAAKVNRICSDLNGILYAINYPLPKESVKLLKNGADNINLLLIKMQKNLKEDNKKIIPVTIENTKQELAIMISAYGNLGGEIKELVKKHKEL